MGWAHIGTREYHRGAADADFKPIDLEVVRRLEALPEDYILDFFWLETRRGVDLLPLLLLLGRVEVARPEGWDFAAIRRQHERGSSVMRLDRRRCFACWTGVGDLYFHHVLEVYHGGSNTARNKVPLCFPCHQYLHPWLKDEPQRGRRDGFEAVGDILANLGDFEGKS